MAEYEVEIYLMPTCMTFANVSLRKRLPKNLTRGPRSYRERVVIVILARAVSASAAYAPIASCTMFRAKQDSTYLRRGVPTILLN